MFVALLGEIVMRRAERQDESAP